MPNPFLKFFKRPPAPLVPGAPKLRTFKELVAIAQALPEYQSLTALVGPKSGALAIEMSYPMEAGFAGQFSEAKLIPRMKDDFRKELSDVHRCIHAITRITFMTRNKVFATLPSHKLMKPADYRALDSDSDLIKAAKWVSYNSGTFMADQTGDHDSAAIQGLERAIKRGAELPMWDDHFLESMRKHCTPPATLNADRPMDPQAKYPSAAGGQYVLRQAFAYMQAVPKPARESDGWRVVACFLLGVILRSHSFLDGNGRTARCAYAAALRKGGLPFTAPTRACEDEICKF